MEPNANGVSRSMTTDAAASDAPSSLPTDDYTGLTGAVRELVTIMREGGISQLDVSRGDLRISLSAHAAPASAAAMPAAHAVGGETPTRPAEPALDEHVAVVTSPMIGTYYASPAPGELPFIQVGDAVEVGQTVAIIEAMKIMNEIVAEQAGLVEQILVRDGEPVEYGHPLLRLRLHP